MKKKLPNVFANPIGKKLNNVQDVFNSGKNKILEQLDIETKIEGILSSRDHVYRSNVLIITEDEEYEKVIIGRTGKFLLTIDGEKIPLVKIKDIKKL